MAPESITSSTSLSNCQEDFSKVIHFGDDEVLDRQDSQEHMVELGEQSSDFQAYMTDCAGNRYSPLHDVPLQEDWSAFFNIICTVSIASPDPFVCSIHDEFNPFVAPGDSSEVSLETDTFNWNHGILPRTWGDWRKLETHHGGIPPSRQYPLEVIDISSRTPVLGCMYSVKPLAAFSVVQKHNGKVELCWKVIAIDSQDPMADQLHDLVDLDNLLPGTLDDIKLWASMCQYQSAGEASELLNLLGRRPASARETLSIIMQAHASWKHYANEHGIVIRNPLLRPADEDEVHDGPEKNDFDYLKASETIYEQAWASSSPEWKKEDEEEDEEIEESDERNRSKSMSFTYSEKKCLEGLDIDEADLLRRTPSLKETSKKWFKRTISSFVGNGKPFNTAKEFKESKSCKKGVRKSTNLRNFFKLSNSEAYVDHNKAHDFHKDGEKSGEKSFMEVPSKPVRPKRDRVMVQFSEAPKLFRQNTSFAESRRLTRMDTMPAPNSHTLAAEAFRFGLERVDSGSECVFPAERRLHPRSMAEIMENLSLSDPDSPQAHGSEHEESEVPVVESSGEAKVDLSHVNDQISRMEMELQAMPGELMRARTLMPDYPAPPKNMRNRYGSFSGSLVANLGPLGKNSPFPDEARKGEAMAKATPGTPTMVKKAQWSPAIPKVYKAFKGTGFSSRGPLPAKQH